MLSLISDIYPERGLLRRDQFKAKHVAIEIGKSDLVWISILIIIIKKKLLPSVTKTYATSATCISMMLLKLF
jgi:hypothetical protein